MKYNRIFASFSLSLFLAIFSCFVNGQEPGEDISLSVNALTVSYNRQTRTFEVVDSQEGLLLSAGIIESGSGDTKVSTFDPLITPVLSHKTADELHVQFGESLTVVIQLMGDSIIRLSGANTESDPVSFTARAPLSDRTLACYLQDEQSRDNQTIVQTLGVMDVP